MWKVSCFYEKVHDLANFGGYAVIQSVVIVLDYTKFS